MNYKDLKLNKYYYTTYKDQGFYIFYHEEFYGYNWCLNSKPTRFYHASGLHDKNGFTDFRKATLFEIQWLKECIKENRYVSKDEVKWKSSYEIYY